MSQPHNTAGAAATVTSPLDAGQRFGQGGCPQRAVLGGGAPRALLKLEQGSSAGTGALVLAELSTRLSPCLEESSA